MTRKVIQVALNGVTGRMGYRQHLVRSLLAIREQGGIRLDDGTVLYPEPILVGRSEDRLRAIAERHGLPRWTTSLDEVLGDPDVDVYFDTQVTSARETALARAIEAGKHVYTEKPLAASAAAAFALAEAAKTAGITHGIVQDKLFLPGVIKLRRLVREGFFGRVLSVRLEFGYWVFDGDGTPAQRPSWNYRAEDGGGIVLDMFPHWHYLLEDLFGPVSSVYARQSTHLPKRWDEAGEPYEVTADDAAYAILEFAGGAIASVNSSWAVRVNRRELLETPGGRHPRQRGGGAAQLRRPAQGVHPDAGLEPGPARPARLSGDVDRRAGQRRVRQRLQGAVGAVPAGRRGGSALQVGPVRRRQGRPAGRARAAVVRRGPPGRDSGMSAAISLPGRAAPLEITPPGLGGRLPAARPRGASTPPPTSPRSTAAIWSTGSPPCASATICGTTGSRSPRRWTPRSAAWACPGGWPGS